MPNVNREIDKTHLSIDVAEQRLFLHRDYIAHCFRWSHIVKYLLTRRQYRGKHILDIGCGKDLPLPRLMYSTMFVDFKYTGCDMNKLTLHPMLQPAVDNGKIEIELLGQTDASVIKDLKFGKADIIISFECLEHMHPRICRRLLANIYELLADDGVVFISTPCFNGSAANNHVSELTYEALGAVLEDLDFNIDSHYGTFISQRDLYTRIKEDEHLTKLCHKLNDYYNSEIFSVIFAPLYPELARNVIWQLSKKNKVRKFKYLKDVKTPWTSNKDWMELDA